MSNCAPTHFLCSLVMLLHTISEFVKQTDGLWQMVPTYWYEGICPKTQQLLRLPRTPLAEAIACGLMQQLEADDRRQGEGKMYGILLVKTLRQEYFVLKAFSGLLEGQSSIEGWVPAIPGRECVQIFEATTLEQLEAMKKQLIELQNIPERSKYQELKQVFQQQREKLRQQHQKQRRIRAELRQTYQQTLNHETLSQAVELLNRQSQLEGIQWRDLKRSQQAQLQPLKTVIEQADTQVQAIKHDRKTLSRQLQSQMHAAYWLTNFAGESLSLQAFGGALPTGTGDCCAPKLLHYAATQQLQPVAMAEFWWGLPLGDKQPGEFYGACRDRCQPIMGFLLSGLSTAMDNPPSITPPTILYEDPWLVAIDKPAGLLSIPGRYRHSQDSVLSRLRSLRLDALDWVAAHRLDQDTSGILLLARNQDTLKSLNQQFEQRRIQKCYEAIVMGVNLSSVGVINLPLWADPDNRPYQRVDWQRGKPSLTRYQVLEQTADHTRIQFFPFTGRTHQLRVHAADPQGLGAPILGDRLYSASSGSTRLHLHAKELTFQHPESGHTIHLISETPF